MKVSPRDSLTWLAVAAILVVIAIVLRDHLAFSHPSYGADMVYVWNALHLFVHGDSHILQHSRADSYFAYPPPFLVILAPLGWLSLSTAIEVTQWFDLLALALTIGLWARVGRRSFPPAACVLAASFAATETIILGQLSTAVSVLALTACAILMTHHRWFLAGVALALGLMRIGNAAPIAIAILVFVIRTRDLASLYRLVVGVATVLLPPTLLLTLLNPGWPSEYIAELHGYTGGGPALLVSQTFGFAPYLFFVGIGLAACTAILWKSMDIDRLAAILCLSVFFAPVADSYAATFGLAGLARLAGRKKPGTVALVLTIALPWIVWFFAGRLNVAPYIATPSADLAVVAVVTTFVLRGDPSEHENVAE